jgi:hypothetical protein
MPFEHQPGSPEAVAQGCTCSPALNHNGDGAPGPGGRPIFHCDLGCPIQGIEIARHAIHAGQAHVIPSPDEDEG